MSSKTEIITAKEVELQVITTEKRKAMLHAIKLQNTFVFIDTLVREFWRDVENPGQLGYWLSLLTEIKHIWP